MDRPGKLLRRKDLVETGIGHSRNSVCQRRSDILWIEIDAADTLHDPWRQESCWESLRLHGLMGEGAVTLDQTRSKVMDPMRALGFEPIDSSLFCLPVRFRS